jgi:hypothetical protein
MTEKIATIAVFAAAIALGCALTYATLKLSIIALHWVWSHPW